MSRERQKNCQHGKDRTQASRPFESTRHSDHGVSGLRVFGILSGKLIGKRPEL
jgi:hypothetical protein